MTRSEARYQTEAPGGRATARKPAESLSRSHAGTPAPLVWAHSCPLNKHAPTSTPRAHHIPYTRIPTGLIAACPYCGTVNHRRHAEERP